MSCNAAALLGRFGWPSWQVSRCKETRRLVATIQRHTTGGLRSSCTRGAITPGNDSFRYSLLISVPDLAAGPAFRAPATPMEVNDWRWRITIIYRNDLSPSEDLPICIYTRAVFSAHRNNTNLKGICFKDAQGADEASSTTCESS